MRHLLTVVGAVACVLALWGGGARAAEGPDAKLVEAFRADCAAKAAAAEKVDMMTVVGKQGWLFLGKELRHLGVGEFWGEKAAKVTSAAKPEWADPLPVILDFKAQMDKMGIELILLPVPPKAVIYPDMVCDAVKAGTGSRPRMDTAHQGFYALLRKSGVKVLDLTDEFLARRTDKEGAVFCKQDTHWSGAACVLAARRIAGEIRDRPWLKAAPKLDLASATRPLELQGDLWKMLPGAQGPRETIRIRVVGTKDVASLTPVEPDRASPIVLLGDSHNLIFHAGDDMQAKGAGLADQLAMELRLAVDLIGVRGSGATPARVNLLRRARADSGYLAGKKLVLWCFGAREFTESAGWRKVPIVKSK